MRDLKRSPFAVGQVDPLVVHRQRSYAEWFGEWAGRQVDAGCDPTVPEGRPSGSDWNLHGPAMEASAEAEAEVADRLASLAASGATFHLAGQHDQKTHGRGHGVMTVGRDLLAEVGVARLGEMIRERRQSYAHLQARSFAVVAHEQGYDGHPNIVSKAEMDKLVADGAPQWFRGVRGFSSDGKTAAEYAEEFRRGEPWWCDGANGAGVYFSARESEATRYADVAGGGLLRAVPNPDAKVVSFTEIDERLTAAMAEAKARGEEFPPHLIDEGAFAAALGYDAMTGTGQKIVVLNRTALIVEEAQ